MSATDTLDRYEEAVCALTKRLIDSGQATQLPDGSIVFTPGQWANYIMLVAATAARAFRPRERVH